MANSCERSDVYTHIHTYTSQSNSRVGVESDPDCTQTQARNFKTYSKFINSAPARALERHVTEECLLRDC